MNLSSALKKLNYDIRQQALNAIKHHYDRVEAAIGPVVLKRDLVLQESDETNEDQTIGELSYPINSKELQGTVFCMMSEVGGVAIKDLPTDKLIELLEILEEMEDK